MVAIMRTVLVAAAAAAVVSAIVYRNGPALGRPEGLRIHPDNTS